MVSGPSKLIDPLKPAVLDTSVVINLAATGVAGRILAALPMPAIVLDSVKDDLARNSDSDRPALEVLTKLIATQAVRLEKSSDLNEGYFESLVAGSSPDTLDDGEAATIALALEKNATAILDERKALRICRENYAALQTASTIDILSHPSVARVLGPDILRDAVKKSLEAHMRIFPEHIEWLVELLGVETVSKYESVPASIRASLTKGRP
jgi:predicted nucleic acid-binding protein